VVSDQPNCLGLRGSLDPARAGFSLALASLSPKDECPAATSPSL
jgi:hypothetical protein